MTEDGAPASVGRAWPILYCERTDLSFVGEPLNTLSNLAFLAAMLIAARAYRRTGRRDPWLILLIALTGAIFIGSTAFHAAPNRVTVVMDVVPIQLFMLGYLALALRRFLELRRLAVALGLAAFAGAVFGLQAAIPSPRLAAISAYLAALAALAIVGAFTWRRDHATGAALGIAAGLFLVSLAARQSDLALCASLPFGMHWLWHLFNGAVLCILLLAAIGFGQRRTAHRFDKDAS
jgi:MFS family permease